LFLKGDSWVLGDAITEPLGQVTERRSIRAQVKMI
jgi:hypothetical protein